jgi:hypothetical protein
MRRYSENRITRIEVPSPDALGGRSLLNRLMTAKVRVMARLANEGKIRAMDSG